MWGGNINLGGIEVLAYMVMGLFVAAVVVPLVTFLIRFLNQTWFDPDR